MLTCVSYPFQVSIFNICLSTDDVKKCKSPQDYSKGKSIFMCFLQDQFEVGKVELLVCIVQILNLVYICIPHWQTSPRSVEGNSPSAACVLHISMSVIMCVVISTVHITHTHSPQPTRRSPVGCSSRQIEPAMPMKYTLVL